MKLIIYAKQEPEIRGQDAYGSGEYLASRGKNRKHKGIDPILKEGDLIGSVCDGVVTKIWYPYSQAEPNAEWSKWKIEKHNKKKAMRYVQVTDENGYDVRYFYIIPSVKISDKVKTGDVLGIARGIEHIYSGITEHYHFEIKRNGETINPNEYLKNEHEQN